MVVCGDLATDDRGPAFTVRAVDEAGVRSLLSNRLFVRDGTVAALTICAERPGAFDERAVAVAGVFAAHAAMAVQAADERARVDNLEIALRNSRRIGTAVGILMHQHHVDEQEAFELLRQHSQHSNRKLADIAAEVVYTGAL
jgi:GAF domain-containing protein